MQFVKQQGFSDRQIAFATQTTEDEVRAYRKQLGVIRRFTNWWIPVPPSLNPTRLTIIPLTKQGNRKLQSSDSAQGDDSRRGTKSHRTGNRI